jgi:hypothetical protein
VLFKSFHHKLDICRIIFNQQNLSKRLCGNRQSFVLRLEV